MPDICQGQWAIKRRGRQHQCLGARSCDGMEEGGMSKKWRPGAGAGNLLRALKGETSGTSTPVTGIPDARLEGKEERRGRGNQELIAEKN